MFQLLETLPSQLVVIRKNAATALSGEVPKFLASAVLGFSWTFLDIRSASLLRNFGCVLLLWLVIILVFYPNVRQKFILSAGAGRAQVRNAMLGLIGVFTAFVMILLNPLSRAASFDRMHAEFYEGLNLYWVRQSIGIQFSWAPTDKCIIYCNIKVAVFLYADPGLSPEEQLKHRWRLYDAHQSLICKRLRTNFGSWLSEDDIQFPDLSVSDLAIRCEATRDPPPPIPEHGVPDTPKGQPPPSGGPSTMEVPPARPYREVWVLLGDVVGSGASAAYVPIAPQEWPDGFWNLATLSQLEAAFKKGRVAIGQFPICAGDSDVPPVDGLECNVGVDTTRGTLQRLERRGNEIGGRIWGRFRL